MKSTREQLLNRGFAFEADVDLYKNCGENELLPLLRDNDAYKRTISVKLLSKNPKETYIPIFCEMLKSGEKLYTKLELQSALKGYGEKSIRYVVPLLGTIGNNHHTKIELVDIHKKSYPCPRDIAGMILVRIGPAVFPALKKLLDEDTETGRIYEAIDVIGHITWNFGDYSMEKPLLDYYKKHRDNEFVQWKTVRAFQSFNSPEIVQLLKKTIKESKNRVIAEEAKRSINRIEKRKMKNAEV